MSARDGRPAGARGTTFASVTGMEADLHAPQPSGAFDGTFALLWAILASGIDDFCRSVRQGRLHAREFRSARAWIFSRRESLTGFESLCSVFDLDAPRIRRRLLDFERTGGRTDVSIASLLQTRSCSPAPDASGERLQDLRPPSPARLEH